VNTIVVSGPPGAGKTTACAVLAARAERGVHLLGDAFWPMIVGGYVEPWLPEARAQNEAVVDALASAALAFDRHGYTVVVDGILGPWFLDRFAARFDGAPFHYVVLQPPLEVALARAAARGEAGLSASGPIVQLHEQFARDERIADKRVDNAELTPEQTADAIEARLAAGALLVS
jgi:adenylate kinase family enzyme